MKNNLAKTIIELKESNMLDVTETNRLRSMFNSKDVDIVISCVLNEVDKSIIDLYNNNLAVYSSTKPHSVYIGEIIGHYVKE